jgi:2-polyprenyl-3-methyl-5-hydroxy-6-metoxy-1,4-benzoquinol methylase
MDKNVVKDTWNNYADGWKSMVDNKLQKFRAAIRNPAVIKLLGDVKNKKVLDIACGEGDSSRMIQSLGAKVVGVDISEEMIRLAQSRDDEVEYLVASANEMPTLKKSSFDVVVCLSMMNIDSLDSTFAEVFRVLKKSGSFVMSTAHPCFFGRPGRKIIKLQDDRLGIFVNDYFSATASVESFANNAPDGSSVSFKTITFPYKVSDYMNALIKAGFVIEQVEEPRATDEKLLADAEVKFWSTHAARNLIIKARKN